MTDDCIRVVDTRRMTLLVRRRYAPKLVGISRGYRSERVLGVRLDDVAKTFRLACQKVPPLPVSVRLYNT